MRCEECGQKECCGADPKKASADELYESLEESQAELQCVYDELRKHQAPKISDAFLRLMNRNRAALAKARGEGADHD